MAGFPWNNYLRNNNVHGSSHTSVEWPQRLTIACRVCDHPFPSISALIDHLEFHMNDRTHHRMMSRNIHRRRHFYHPYYNNNLLVPPRLPPPPPPSPSVNGSSMNQERLHTAVRPTPRMVGGAGSSQVASLDGNNFGVGLGLPQPTSWLQTPHNDRTKPMIQQLDRSILRTSAPQGGESSGNSNSTSTKLDLTLKLSL